MKIQIIWKFLCLQVKNFYNDIPLNQKKIKNKKFDYRNCVNFYKKKKLPHK